MQNDGEPWEQVKYICYSSFFVSPWQKILFYVTSCKLLTNYLLILFQHPAEIIIEHHKQIPIFQIGETEAA